MKVTIWVDYDCGHCAGIRMVAMRCTGEVVVLNGQDLIDGIDSNVEAMTQLAMQNMELPVVNVNGEFISWHVLEEEDRFESYLLKIAEEEDGCKETEKEKESSEENDND